MSQRSNVEIRSVVLLTVSSSFPAKGPIQSRARPHWLITLDDTVNVITTAIQIQTYCDGRHVALVPLLGLTKGAGMRRKIGSDAGERPQRRHQARGARI
jgi:hypothetical protein